MLIFNSSDCFTTQDLSKILSKCWEARTKWMNIGLQLKLVKSELDTIQVKCKDDPDKCFIAMLDSWLRTNRPMRADLIAVLKERTVAFHQLAEDLEGEGLEWCG